MNASKRKASHIAEAGLLLVVLIWGINFSVMKSAVAGVDPLVFNALRFSLSVAFLGALCWREERLRPVQRVRGKRPWGSLIVLGIIGHLAYQTAFILGLERTTAGNSALLLGSAPLWTALFSHLARWERLRRASWAGLVLSFGGAALITLAKPDLNLGNSGFVGDLLTLAAAVAWGAYTAANKPLLKHWSPLGLATRSMAIALPFLWLMAWPRLERVTISELDLDAWGAIFYAGVLSTGVAYALWNHAIRHVGAARTAVVANLMPVVAILVAVFTLGERVSGIQLIGGSLVIGGVLWVRRAGQPKAQV